MKYRMLILTVVAVVVTGFVFVTPCSAGFREYYIHGKVVDENKAPLEKVEILLREINTSKSYGTKTNKEGKFKLAGLPHGIFKVTLKKDGFQTRNDEWRFEAPQRKMKKVKVDTVIMVSAGKIQEIKLNKKLKGMFDDATTKIRQNDFDGALVLLEKMQKEKPGDPNSLYLMGICYLNKNELETAIEKLEKVIAAMPSFAGAHFQLGICYQKSDQKEKALASYKTFLKQEPKNMVALYNTGLILYSLKQTKEAVTFFEKALQLTPGSPEILEMTGLSYIQLENYSKALEYLKKATAASNDPEKKKSLDELITGLKEQVKRN